MRSTMRFPVAACSAFILLLTATPAGAALRSVGKVVQSWQVDDALELRLSSGARVRVGFATPDVVRVRMNPTGRFEADVSYAIEGAPPRSKALLAKQGATTELRSASGTRIVVKHAPELAISVYDSAGRLVVASPWSTSRMPRRVSVRIAQLRPGTRYVVRAQVQAYVLCKGTRAKPCRSKFTVRNRPAGTVTFRTKA